MLLSSCLGVIVPVVDIDSFGVIKPSTTMVDSRLSCLLGGTMVGSM